MTKRQPKQFLNCIRCGDLIPEKRKADAKYCGWLCRNKTWQEANPEKMKRAIKNWQKRHPERGRAANKKTSRARVTREHEAIPIRDCAACGTPVVSRHRRRKSRWCSVVCQSRQQAKDWARKNPGKARQRGMRYMASKKNAAPQWLTKQHRDEMALQYSRAMALSAETGIPHEVDHIVPLQSDVVCGLHVPWNLQVLTALKNRQKSNSLIAERVSDS